jgi:hypothetical protein
MQSRLLLAFIAFLALFAAASPALAQYPRDGIANKKIDQAINDRYVATDFDGAEEALESVIKACGEKCSPAVLARAHMYIGIVRGAGRNDLKGAQKAFEEALAKDPNVELDDALATPEVKKAFESAKGGKKPDAKPAEKPAEKPVEKAVEKPEPKAPPPEEKEEEKPKPEKKPAKAAEKKPEPKPEPEKVKPPEPPPKPEGSCVHDGECDAGEACVNEMCTLVPVCKVDADCGASKCVDGQCKMRHFVGLHVAQDIAFGGSVKACGVTSEYGCYLADTEDPYLGLPYDGGVETSTTGFATTRILLSYELPIMPNITVGARAGLALGGGPQAADGTSFMPVHLEARGAYYFGADVFDKPLRPYAYAGGGLAQVDVKSTTTVKECRSSTDATECMSPGGGSLLQSEIDSLPEVPVDVYNKMGQGFIAVGGGVAYALSPSLLAQANLAFMLMLPSSGFVLEPSLGLVLAL